ncbi:LysR family transcriptional regulator [Stutzerimonas kunmingensis]|uniref:LysR family transcriptional regulator n=1 Tax=Gammaproteobacteria TaxID=1236 RepID=UPI0035E40CCF
MNTFLTLAQVCNFQKAASQLGIAQPTVTQHIQKLEEKLGVTLFERTRYGCKATQPALFFYLMPAA